STSGAETSKAQKITLIGTWYAHSVPIPNGGGSFSTGVAATNPGWSIRGRWFTDGAAECVLGSALARRLGIAIGQNVTLHAGAQSVQTSVVGIVSAGGQEDDAVLAPLAIAQQLSGEPGRYRRLLVSALTKPADAFSERDPRTMTADEYERW